MNLTNNKYQDFSFTIHDLIKNDKKFIICIDDDFTDIVDNIEFGSTYSYEIFTHIFSIYNYY